MLDPVDRTTEDALRDQLDASRLREDVAALADLRRYPASDDQWAAADYVAETLSADGVQVDVDTLEALVSVPDHAAVTATTPRRRDLGPAITTAFSASTPPSGVSGEVVHVDPVPDSPERLGRVAGRVAFTRGLPTPEAVRTLEAAGAVAILFGSPTEGELHEMIVSPVWGTPGEDDADRLPDVPVAEIHQHEADWLAERVAGGPVEVTVETRTTTELRELPCPVARVDGTESERYAVVGNHLDSWHEGVTDNATAVAATMELARVFAENPPRRGVVFGFWPGHSMGRYAGSARYVDDNWLDLRADGVAYLHLDLLGLDGADVLWSQQMAELEHELLDVLEDGSLPLVRESTDGDDDGLIGTDDRPGRNSDQSFWGPGLSSLLAGGRFSPDHPDAGPIGGGWWWHTPADTRDKVDFDLLAEEVSLFVALLSRLCNSTVLPHDFRATAAELRDVVDEVDRASDGSVEFHPIYDALDDLTAGLERVYADLDGRPGGEVDAAVEDLQVALGNALVPALYVAGEMYDHDPALSQDLAPAIRPAESLPETTGRERAFTERTVARGVTKIAHRVREAADDVDRYLEDR